MRLTRFLSILCATGFVISLPTVDYRRNLLAVDQSRDENLHLPLPQRRNPSLSYRTSDDTTTSKDGVRPPFHTNDTRTRNPSVSGLAAGRHLAECSIDFGTIPGSGATTSTSKTSTSSIQQSRPSLDRVALSSPSNRTTTAPAIDRRQIGQQVTAIVDGSTVTWINTHDGYNGTRRVVATINHEIDSWQNTYTSPQAAGPDVVIATINGDVVSWQGNVPASHEFATASSSTSPQSASQPLSTEMTLRSTYTPSPGSRSASSSRPTTASSASYTPSTTVHVTAAASPPGAGSAMGGALMSTYTTITDASVVSDGPHMTIAVTNSFGYPLSISYGSNAGAPTLNGSPGTVNQAQTTTVIAPYGWAGRFYLGLSNNTLDIQGSKIEASYGSDPGQPPITDVDVSYVDGYTVPIVCSCDGAPVTGCNKNLFNLESCPDGYYDEATGVCGNPLQDALYTNGPAAPFFAPCQGSAYTFPWDNAANHVCQSNQISCCIDSSQSGIDGVGSNCPAPSNQPP